MLKPVVLTKLMLVGRRAPLDRTPLTAGMQYEDVVFQSSDGLDIHGWWIPAANTNGPAPAIAFVHGWLWNRLGNVAGQVPVPDKSVDFLPAAKALHEAGYGVLLFDLRHHGESARGKAPLTFGVHEARDFVGAVNYLRGRPDVDGERIGARRLLDGRQHDHVRHARVPADQGAARDPADAAARVQHELRPRRARAARPRVADADRLDVRRRCGCRGRRSTTRHRRRATWATRSCSTSRAPATRGAGWRSSRSSPSATPNALPLVRFESAGRYEGYRYISERSDDVVGFFREHL